MSYFRNAKDEATRSIAFEQVASAMGKRDIMETARFIDANHQLATDQIYITFSQNARKSDYMLGIQAINNIQDPKQLRSMYSNYMYFLRYNRFLRSPQFPDKFLEKDADLRYLTLAYSIKY